MASPPNRPPGRGPQRPRGFFDQARQAADSLVNEVQQRLPSDLVRQLRSGQRAVESRLQNLQQQIGRSASQADVDRLTHRIDDLARQIEDLLRHTFPDRTQQSTPADAQAPAPSRRPATRPGRTARSTTSPPAGRTQASPADESPAEASAEA
ncbi:MAG: hypothetical protein WAM30_08000, partial [Candidatus Dormiibacterota bacterium]